jgi:hypothetical protein
LRSWRWRCGRLDRSTRRRLTLALTLTLTLTLALAPTLTLALALALTLTLNCIRLTCSTHRPLNFLPGGKVRGCIRP